MPRDVIHLMKNQDFGAKKNSNWAENSYLDQIEGAEFKFLGLDIRFVRNERRQFWIL